MNPVVVLVFISSFLALSEARFAKVSVSLDLTVADESPKGLTEEMIRICGEETNLSLRELNKFQQQDFSQPSESVQCFTHCLYEQMGLMHDGVFVERDILGLLSEASNPDRWLERQCHMIEGANKCETAFKIHQCRQNLKTSGKDVEVTTPPAQAEVQLP